MELNKDSHNILGNGASDNDTPRPTIPPLGLVDGRVPVASITSPCESGRYRAILRDYAALSQIEGSLVALDYEENGADGEPVTKTVLCQVSKMDMQNPHHENIVLRALLRQKGAIPGISGVADSKEVTLLPMDTVLQGTEIHQMPRTIPPTGTAVRFASREDISQFSGKHRALFNIGYLYETSVPVGLMLKHFGAGDDGWGDARMLGVFGATGSGKTVMAAQVMAGFAARPEMGMLIIDPQGQFTGMELGKDKAVWSWDLAKVFQLAGRGQDVEFVSISEVAMERPQLFAELLVRNRFLEALSLQAKKESLTEDMVTLFADWLRQNKDATLGALRIDTEHEGQTMLTHIRQQGLAQYAQVEQKQKSMQRAAEIAPYKERNAEAAWEKVREMFARPKRISDLFDDVLVNRKIVILDVSIDEDYKHLFCGEIMHGINRRATDVYRIQQGEVWRGEGDDMRKYQGRSTNALIVIDEAHLFAPQSASGNKDQDQERMLATLKSAIRTTRKLSVGWFYITQSIADFNKDIFRQIQTKLIGFGVGTGADDDHLETALNHDKELVERYRRLPKPTSTGMYPYAIVGELVALGNGSRALFITAPKTQQDLIDLNPQHFKYPSGQPVRRKQRASSGNTNGRALPSARQLPLAPQTPPDDDLPF
jgi:hypothetical protein